MSRSASNTKKYLEEVLTKDFGEWTTFRFPKGEGEQIVQRMRVELTRIKKRVRATGRRLINFKLVTRWDNESPDANQFDIVSFAKVRNMLEKKGVSLSNLEAMLVEDMEELHDEDAKDISGPPTAG